MCFPRYRIVMTIPAMPVHVGLLWNTRESAVGCDQAEMALTLRSHCGYVWNDSFDISKMDYE